MTDKQRIQNIIDRRGYETTASQYEILSELTDIEPEVCKKICSLQRDIRQLLNSDEVAMKKADEWRLPEHLHSLNNQTQLKV